ncbi:MAG TPA: hypothetical protein VHE58_04275 [Burkholderiales bacterium]|nr:hypothetical protein [Burkholderiales bacterium]
MTLNADPPPSLDALSALGSQLLNQERPLTRGTALALVIAVGIFANWPALLSDSIMWDDWIVLTWITQARPDWMFQFFSSYGVTPYILVDFPFIAFVQHAATSVLIAKIIYFSSVIISAVLIMLISKRVAHGNLLFATLAGASAACCPAWSGEGFHLAGLIYSLIIASFLVGMLFFIQVASSTRRRLAIRVIALSALFLSFSLNSLLVLFYALVPAVFYASLQNELKDLRTLFLNARVFLIRHLDFLVLPIVFWVLKETLMPRVGIYVRYNKISFDWIRIFISYLRLIPDILGTNIFVPFSIPIGSLAAVVIFLIVFLGSRLVLARFENDAEAARSHLKMLFGLGILALLGTALPYYLVGRRTFYAYGFNSRDSVLFPLSVSWITAALFCMLLKLRASFQAPEPQGSGLLRRRVAIGAFAALIVAQSFSNWRNHADWQAHYAYYRSAIEKVAHDQLVGQASVIQVIDKLPRDRTLRTWNYPTSIWTEIISAAFQKTTRLAIPYPPENSRFFTRDEINRRVRETEVAFMLSGIDLDGQQIRLTVEPGSGARDPIHLALAYWRARFFAPDDMPKLLDSLTRIRSERIGGE